MPLSVKDHRELIRESSFGHFSTLFIPEYGGRMFLFLSVLHVAFRGPSDLATREGPVYPSSTKRW